MKYIHLHAVELKRRIKISALVLFLARTHNTWIPQGLKLSEKFLDHRSKHGLASVQVRQNFSLGSPLGPV